MAPSKRKKKKDGETVKRGRGEKEVLKKLHEQRKLPLSKSFLVNI